MATTNANHSNNRQDPHRQRRTHVSLRSLAACRMGVGALLALDILWRFSESTAFLSDTGLLSTEQWKAVYGSTCAWSLMLGSPSLAWLQGLLSLHLLLAILVCVGWRTRVVTPLCWALTASLHMRNPLIINSGDDLLRMLLFWGAFSQWGHVWSVDACRASLPPQRPSWGSRLAAASILAQVSLMYAITGWLKLNDVWLHGEALGRVMELDFAIRPLARTLRDYPQWLAWGSRVTPWMELIGPLLVWMPWKRSVWRIGIPIVFILFHAFIESLLHVGWFGAASAIAWLAFLPDCVWGQSAAGPPTSTVSRSSLARGASLLSVILLCICWLAVLAGNAFVVRRTWDTSAEPTETPSGSWTVVADIFALHQDWSMFREPPAVDSWIVVKAKSNDVDMDLLRDIPYEEDGSPQTAAALPSQHWRYFFRRMRFPQFQSVQSNTLRCLVELWNQRRPQNTIDAATMIEFSETYQAAGFETQILDQLAPPPDPNQPFNLDDALNQLDSAPF